LFVAALLVSACSDDATIHITSPESETELTSDIDEETDESGDQLGSALPEKSVTITARQSNMSCLAGDAPSDPVTVERVFENVTFNRPVNMSQVPGSSDQPFYIVEKGGRIFSVPANDNANDNDVTEALQLNVYTHGESGVTGMAFHPDYATNGLVYIAYATKPTEESVITHHLSVFERAADGLSFTNEQELLSIPKDNAEHFGGALAFGPDGYLYFSVGDDGDNLDGDLHPLEAQNPESWLGSILRLDVNNAAPPLAYSIPADNPDFTGNGATEVWAMGFRNPWRIAFDSQQADTLWTSDVGSRLFEEINKVERGSNHGWPMCEGPCDPSNADFIDPAYSYSNLGGAAVIGGFVYRGSQIPELYGKYIFSDYIKQTLNVLDPEFLPQEPLYVQSLLNLPVSIAGFAQDNNHELYALDFFGGGVYRFVPNPSAQQNTLPANLSETGCFDSLDNGNPQPADGVIDYVVSQRFWSDGASKARQLALPDGETIDTSNPSNWQIPIGGVTIKHFYWQDKIIETRFLARNEEQVYTGYTYEWNEQQNDASLVPNEGVVRELDGITWTYPSRIDCLRCHTEQAGFTLSLESRQLNVVDDAGLDQMDLMAEHGYLDSASPEKLDSFISEHALSDESISIEERATSWLHVNCSSCHRGAGSAGRAEWDARFEASLAERRVCEQKPFETVGLVPAAEALFAPGSHEFSTLWLRANSRGEQISMPPIASTVVDQVGIDLLAAWIDSYNEACPALGDALPGRVQAQDYEKSFDLTAGSADNACSRGDNTDLEVTNDMGGSCAVGNVDPGEWLEFEVHATDAELHTLVLRASSGHTPNDEVAHIQVKIDDAIVFDQVNIPNNGWSTYQDVEAGPLSLEPGNHTVRITFTTGFTNLNYFELR